MWPLPPSARAASSTSRALASTAPVGANRTAGSRLPWRPLPGPTRSAATSSGTRQSTPTTSAPAWPMRPSSSPVPTPKWIRGTPYPATASNTLVLAGITERR